MTKSKNIDNSDNSQDKTSKQADEPIPTPPPTGSHSQRRRRLLTQLAAGGGVIATGNLLPTEWKRPVIQSVLLPAHAQTSPAPSPSPGDCCITSVELSSPPCTDDYNEPAGSISGLGTDDVTLSGCTPGTNNQWRVGIGCLDGDPDVTVGGCAQNVDVTGSGSTRTITFNAAQNCEGVTIEIDGEQCATLSFPATVGGAGDCDNTECP